MTGNSPTSCSNSRPSEKYKIILRNGLLVEEMIGEVFYHYFKEVHHIEFRGRAMSETGYFSHFFYPSELENKSIEDYLTEFINNTSISGKVESIIKIK